MYSVDKLDHIVLTVRDIDDTIDFYTNALGMELIIFGDGRQALHFGDQKINLHQRGGEFEPKAVAPMCGSADLCFITSTSIDDFKSYLESIDIDIIEGPVARTGAVGGLISIYLRDPDGNLIELSNHVN